MALVADGLVSERLADPEHGDVDDVVDVDRYPLHDPGSAACRSLVTHVRRQLESGGCAQLDGFLQPGARVRMQNEVATMARRVPIRRHHASVYARADAEQGLVDDPRTRRLEWCAGHVTRDMFSPFDVALQLYVSPPFKRFVAACVGLDRVYEYADPIAGLVATVLPPGGAYPWHYDSNEFVVTIMTQAPERGGVFEYVPNLRTPGHENLRGLDDVLTGRAAESICRTSIQPGDLQFFLGRYSLHQVTRTAGSTERHVVVFSYANEPGVIGPLDRTRAVYGRVTEAHLLAADVARDQRDGLIR